MVMEIFQKDISSIIITLSVLAVITGLLFLIKNSIFIPKYDIELMLDFKYKKGTIVPNGHRRGTFCLYKVVYVCEIDYPDGTTKYQTFLRLNK